MLLVCSLIKWTIDTVTFSFLYQNIAKANSQRIIGKADIDSLKGVVENFALTTIYEIIVSILL